MRRRRGAGPGGAPRREPLRLLIEECVKRSSRRGSQRVATPLTLMLWGCVRSLHFSPALVGRPLCPLDTTAHSARTFFAPLALISLSPLRSSSLHAHTEANRASARPLVPPSPFPSPCAPRPRLSEPAAARPPPSAADHVPSASLQPPPRLLRAQHKQLCLHHHPRLTWRRRTSRSSAAVRRCRMRRAWRAAFSGASHLPCLLYTSPSPRDS